MEAEQVLRETMTSWIATRIDEVVWDHRDGFYSFEIVADAFEKGKEFAEAKMKESARKKFYENFTKISEALRIVLTELSRKGYQASKLFVKHSINESRIILTIDENVHDSKEFIDFAYPLLSGVEKNNFDANVNLDISFVNDTASLNVEVIKHDGFGFAYDLIKNIPIE